MNNLARYILPCLLLLSLGLSACAGSAPQVTPASTEMPAEYFSQTIKWLDNLKTCSPYQRSYLNPVFNMQQIDTIKGKEGELCVVIQETAGKYQFECRYTAEGIKIMTQDSFYKDAQNKILSASGSDVTDVMSKQCSIEMIPTPTQ